MKTNNILKILFLSVAIIATYFLFKISINFKSVSTSPIEGDISFKDWLGIVALFLSAIIAVVIGQWLQNIKSKNDRLYNNKFNILAVLLGLRHARSSEEQFVVTINQVPIVFHKNKKVLYHLNDFIESHRNSIEPMEKVLENLDSSLNKMIIEMARDLGYKNVNLRVLKDCFYPDSSLYHYNSKAMTDRFYCEDNQKRYEKLLKLKGILTNDQQDLQ
jgi:hypothetical protein